MDRHPNTQYPGTQLQPGPRQALPCATGDRLAFAPRPLAGITLALALACGVPCAVGGAPSAPQGADPVASLLARADGSSAVAAKSKPPVAKSPASTEVIPKVDDGWAIPVGRIELSYATHVSGQPPLRNLLTAKVELALLHSAYVTPWMSPAAGRRTARPGLPLVHTDIQRLNAAGIKQIHASAINAIEQQLVAFLNEQGIAGVWITVSPKQFRNNQNIRRPGDTTLNLIIHTATIGAVQTIAEGGRFAGQKSRIDNPDLSWIQADSPLQPGAASATANSTSESLLNRRALDNYIDALDRQPGRQVSAAISPSKVPGEVALKYLVHQSKPWTVYFQLANTGTPQTNIWRETYGFTDNELTGNDDILSLNYTTAGFTRENDVNASYSIPILNPDRLRLRIYGGYDSFSSADVGFPGNSFNGDQTNAGGEFILNVYQHRRFFLDTLAGLKYQHIFVDNTLLATTSTGDLVTPYFGLHAQRYSATNQFTADLTVQITHANDSETKLENLGRPLVARNPVILVGDASDAFYLEPLLMPHAYATGQAPLANQVVLSVQGQDAFNQRLIPENEAIAGGLYTVRGYPEAAIAGDSVATETIEYRLHIPHLFPVSPHPPNVFGSPFRFAPQQPAGPTDWDFILKYFVDAGEVVNSGRLSYEQNSVLVGTGLGAELDLKNNLSLQFDWGVALNGVGSNANGNRVTAGSSQFNFVLTCSY